MKMQRLKKLFCVIILSKPIVAGCQVFYPQMDLKSVTAARFSTSQSGVFQAAANPAIVNEAIVEAGMYIEKRYLLKELLSIAGAAIFNFGSGQFAFSLHHFGSFLYNERAASIGLGRKIGAATIGAKFTYIANKAASIYSSTSVSMAISSLFRITDEVVTSVYFSDPHYLFKAAENGRFHPSPGIRLGTGYQPSKYFYMGFEAEKLQGKRANFCFSASHQFSKDYGARLFWSTGNDHPYLALSWQLEKILIETGCSYHISLGLLPSISFSIRKNKSL